MAERSSAWKSVWYGLGRVSLSILDSCNALLCSPSCQLGPQFRATVAFRATLPFDWLPFDRATVALSRFPAWIPTKFS